MKNTSIFLMMLLFLPVVYASTYSCQPVVVEITQLIDQAYTANEPFSVEALITNFPSDKNVFSDIIDDKDNVIQTAQGIFTGGDKWIFYFDPLSPGSYRMRTRLVHPITGDDVVEESNPFPIRTKLTVTFTSSQPVLNTIEDIVLNLWVRPIPPEDWEKVLTVRKLELTGTKDIPVTPRYEDCAGDFCRVIIPAGQIVEPGVYTFTIKISDRDRLYDPDTKSIESIEIIHPKVTIVLDTPEIAQADTPYEIKVSTFGVNNIPLEVDNLEMTVNYPGGAEQVFKLNDFIHTPSSNEYIISMTFVEGQQHYFKVSAWKSGYLSNYIQRNVPVSGGPVCPADITPGVCDQGAEHCDPDCIGGVSPIVLGVGIGIVIIVSIIGFVLWKRS